MFVLLNITAIYPVSRIPYSIILISLDKDKQLLYIDDIFKLPAVGETKETKMENTINTTTEVSTDVVQSKNMLNGCKELLQAVVADYDNNYIAVGYEYSSTTSGGYSEAMIAKFDTNGSLLWQKKLNENSDYYRGVSTDTSNYIAVGYELSSDSNDEALITKFDIDGNLVC